MKKVILASFLCAAILTGSAAIPLADNASAQYSIPAFPGAEGGGMYATGGRNGSVYHVTNLNDSGAGSFRDAVSSSNRIIVFDVGGTINLKSDIDCKGNITIAGQTAPGGNGITLRGGKIGMGGDNIIVRFISSRPGEKGNGSGDYDAWGGSKGSNSIIDHCSIGWANDEQFGLYSSNMNQTLQYSIIGPSNCVSYHSKGAHGFGAMFGKGQNSWHHNLICHSLSRNFRGKVEKTNTMDFVNNVVYDWGYQTSYGTFGHINYINNYFKAGPSTAGGYRYINISSGTAPENYKFYFSGNTMRNPDDTVYSTNMDENNWNGGINYGNAGLTESDYRTDAPMSVKSSYGSDVSVAYNAESAEDAYNNVINYAGAAINAQSRTKIDAQVLEEVRTGTGSLTGGRDFSTVTDESVLNAIETYGIQYCNYDDYYPQPILEKTITDSDNDGMPDEWEAARGLDPNDASDAAGDYLGQGYNNIEYYINDLTVDAFPKGTVTVSKTLSELGDNYTYASEDANAIKLSPTTVSYAEDLTLPTSGSLHNSTITWASSSSDIVIKNNTITSIKRPNDGNKKVTITASISNGDFTLKRSFTITLRSTSLVWTASENDVGKAAGTKLMEGLYNVSELTGKETNTTINGTQYSYYVSGADSGKWADGAATGTAFKYKAYEDGYLTAYVTNLSKTLIIQKENSTESVSITAENGSERMLSSRVEKGCTYYIYIAGSKGRFLSISFDTNAPSQIWKASSSVNSGGQLMENMFVNEAMSYTESPKTIDGVDFTGHISGTTNPSNNGANGASVTYTPSENCTLTVYYKIGANKTFKVNTADGNIVSSYTNKSDTSQYTSTTAELSAGITYYFYVDSSKAEFYGAVVTPKESTVSTAPPETVVPTSQPVESSVPTAPPENTPPQQPEASASPLPVQNTQFKMDGQIINALKNGTIDIEGTIPSDDTTVYITSYDNYGRVNSIFIAETKNKSFNQSINIDDNVKNIKVFMWKDTLPETQCAQISK